MTSPLSPQEKAYRKRFRDRTRLEMKVGAKAREETVKRQAERLREWDKKTDEEKFGTPEEIAKPAKPLPPPGLTFDELPPSVASQVAKANSLHQALYHPSLWGRIQRCIGSFLWNRSF